MQNNSIFNSKLGTVAYKQNMWKTVLLTACLELGLRYDATYQITGTLAPKLYEFSLIFPL